MSAALLLVDIQNDFLPGGALAVPAGDEVIPPAVAMTDAFPIVFATQDWHPANHGSFAANHAEGEVGREILLDGLKQILWPPHCVQGSAGAELAAELDRSRIRYVSPKGEDPEIDSYSGFFDNGKRRKTKLDERLREAGVDTLYICGLATEFCVRFTVLDAISLGYETFLVADACRGLGPEAIEAAVQEMKDAGAKVVTSADAIAAINPRTA